MAVITFASSLLLWLIFGSAVLFLSFELAEEIGTSDGFEYFICFVSVTLELEIPVMHNDHSHI